MMYVSPREKFGFCEVCDNDTPRLYVEEFEQECCELCYVAYGDCN